MCQSIVSGCFDILTLIPVASDLIFLLERLKLSFQPALFTQAFQKFFDGFDCQFQLQPWLKEVPENIFIGFMTCKHVPLNFIQMLMSPSLIFSCNVHMCYR